MMYKLKYLILILILFNSCKQEQIKEFPAGLEFEIALKTPGNPIHTLRLQPENTNSGFSLISNEELPLDINLKIENVSDSIVRLNLKIKGIEETNFNLKGSFDIHETVFDQAYFLLPGFWYRKNLRSPDNTPSTRVSKSWMVREDRLSIPLSAVYNTASGESVSICRTDDIVADVLMPYEKGEIILFETNDIGSVGFSNFSGSTSLLFSYPFMEAPFTYIRKLTLDPPVTAFSNLKKDDVKELSWEIRRWNSASYSDFMKDTWNYSFDKFQPQPLKENLSDLEIKTHLSDYFTQSYTDEYELKGFSGVHLYTDVCEKRGILEVGFVGRVLLNAYNALEFGYEQDNEDMLRMAHMIYDSYETAGFTENGFIREVVDFREQHEDKIYSIRRQSEGLYAIIQYLSLEKKHNRMHKQLTERTIKLLDNILSLQKDNYFPRKFSDQMEVIDSAGGSTSTAIVPLLMAWKYFGDDKYMNAAKDAAVYLEEEIIIKGDYFSSTLDANCEDKEASIYASLAMYYLGLTSSSEEMQISYFQLAEKAAYFALSWYYLWDVPFAPGQMLGDLDFKTRGWGNVSVENNHVDVYIFDFADILKQLAVFGGNERLSQMAELINSSMREQLLPLEGRMCGIAKTGYYPEVVQHTNWDYGQFGKGNYNDLFAPGWTVASLWELLSEYRVYNFFNENTDE